MALQTEHVPLAHLEESGIGGSVGRVATGAALGLDGHVLVDERPLFVDMALEADGVSAGERADLAHGRGSVRIMAVIALHQALIHAVVKRFGKIRFGRGMTAVAQLGLGLDEQVLFFFGVMGRVAVDTADVAAGVARFRKMRLPMAFAMATQAARTGLLSRLPRETENPGFVAAPGNVIRAGAMAALAALARRFLIQRGLPVRTFLPRVVDVLMTGLAGFGSHVFGGIG